MYTIQTDTPESQGICSSHIQNMLKRIDASGIPMHSVLIARNDTLVFETYYKPYTPDKLHRMFSITKTFTAIAIGHLITLGKLSLDDHIVDLFPEKCPKDIHPWIQEVTIRNMLEMRTCHSVTTYKKNMEKDWVESFFTAVPDHPAGTIFHYDTSASHVLCALVEKLTGKSLLDYLKEDVLKDMDLSANSFALSDPFGVTMGGSGICCTSLDLLKLGIFLSNHGKIHGKQIVDAEFIRLATSNLNSTVVKAPLPSEAAGYGFQIWQNERGGFVAYGMGGQLVIVIPTKKLICVTTADTQGFAGGNQIIYNAFYEEILDKISDHPVEITPSSAMELLNFSKNLKINPLQCSLRSMKESLLSKKEFTLLPNNNFTAIELSFQENSGILSLVKGEHVWNIHFGFGEMTDGIFPAYNQYYVASASWLDEDTLYIKCHICDSAVGCVHFQLHFKDNQLVLYTKKTEESLFTEFQNIHYVGYSH